MAAKQGNHAAKEFAHSELNLYDKPVQQRSVGDLIRQNRRIPAEFIDAEVEYFFTELGIENLFFQREPDAKLAEFIESIYAAKILAATRHNDLGPDIELEHITEHGAIFLGNSVPGLSIRTGPNFEEKIDQKYLDNPEAGSFRVESYRSASQMRCYFVEKCSFPHGPQDITVTDLNLIGNQFFNENASLNTADVYQGIIERAVSRTGPVIESFSFENSEERRLVICYRSSAKNFYASISDLYHFYDLYSTRKFVEPFSNGMNVMSIYLQQLPGSKKPHIDVCLQSLKREVSLLYTIPTTPFQSLFEAKTLSLQESVYAFCGLQFAEHFINRLGSEYETLTTLLDSKNEEHQRLLVGLKKRLRLDTFGSDFIAKTISSYPKLVRHLFADFARVHRPKNLTSGTASPNNGSVAGSPQTMPRLARGPTQATLELFPELSQKDMLAEIKKATQSQNEYIVFEAIDRFNRHIHKTNFFQSTKVALSFRMDPAFLPASEYPDRPFGLFFVVANEFRGFHLRFADVARGGIRVIKSVDRDTYTRNVSTLFDENYNLANTQMRKNKDIPESGSKGTILLNPDFQNSAELAFHKYVDGILDILLKGQSPGVKDELVDTRANADTQEILFFGPDEGTADFMNWASSHARHRGASFWKAFTTGRSREMGGIPHDTYGMTTRSVHEYVVGTLEKLHLNEAECTKMQTGGPDGDLGSNEIKLSSDKTVLIVDGGGVLYDPQGLNRQELLRLAEARKDSSHFDTKFLGPHGYRVLVTDKNVTLPNGEVVESGMDFRNQKHLDNRIETTFFVPCGGRPEAVNMSNIKSMYNADKKPRFKFIVEGANLFFSEEARLALERDGIPVFKDASANKGGVTSSSFEVLAALSMDDESFSKLMCMKNDVIPEFYQKYVAEVQKKITENARLEFEILWSEHERTKIPLSTLSNRISNSIVQLSTDLENSTLYNKVQLRKFVLEAYLPKILVDTFGLEKVISHVPESYLRAIFSAFLASRFIYKVGLNYSPFSFFEYMNTFDLS